MEELDEYSEANWLDGSCEELVRELLDDTAPLFVLPRVTEPEPDTSHESMINKLISTVYSGPTIGDVENALSVTFQSGESDGHGISRPIISLPEKGLGKMESKYTLRIKTYGNGLADDGYKWRKYGQKSIKNSPNPRSILVSHKSLLFKTLIICYVFPNIHIIMLVFEECWVLLHSAMLFFFLLLLLLLLFFVSPSCPAILLKYFFQSNDVNTLRSLNIHNNRYFSSFSLVVPIERKKKKKKKGKKGKTRTPYSYYEHR